MYFSSSSSLIMILFQLYFSTLLFTSISSLQTPKHYIVYMGSPKEGDDVHNVEASYLQMLDTLPPREESDERRKVIHYYKHSFKGFSAMLTAEEAAVFSGRDDVVSVFEDSVLQLETTRSWDFLDSLSGLPSSVPFYNNSNGSFAILNGVLDSGWDEVVSEDPMLQLQTTRSWDFLDSLSRHSSSVPIYNNVNESSDIIIGVIDSGIWPESPSFSDQGIGEIPSNWKGTCMEGPDFNQSNCNRKLIGARFYPEINATSARDFHGHGTHAASIAGGARVEGASYLWFARGTAKGGHPGSRIAVYKIDGPEGRLSSVLLKAINDAINDGVDLISISLSTDSTPDYLTDPIAIGAFHAMLKGIMVSATAGNKGPDAFTVANMAPWIFTVAASSIDREFQSSIILGSGMVIQGVGIHFSNRSKAYPLVYSRNVPAASTPLDDAMNCLPGSLNPNKVTGKVVLCVMSNNPNVTRKNTTLVVKDAGARGLILINQKEKIKVWISSSIPYSEVDMSDGDKIRKYILRTKNSNVTILPTSEVKFSKPAPVVARFSSRGPASLTENILKPDIMAPGVFILAAMPPPKRAEPSRPNYRFKSGTSMACPHVTGTAANIKDLSPSWTPSMIKSALMTTAILYDNTGNPVTDTSGLTATPHETGAGEINRQRAVDPGLVFETTQEDYFHFLCYYNYSKKTIDNIFPNTNFSCPENSSKDLISTINYPSISIGNLLRGKPYGKVIERTVTNVGPKRNVTYVAHIDAPEGLVVDVAPNRLVFTENVSKVSFHVSFWGTESASKGYHHGSLKWSDEYHLVRSVFSVNIN